MKRFAVAAILACLAFAASALPNVDAVQAEIAKGNYAQAEDMMRDVIAAKPGSARAHYIYAEILAHNRQFTMAAAQAARAKAIDPKLQFTQPEKFRIFEQTLEREQAAEQRQATRQPASVPALYPAAPPERGSGVPNWVWGMGLAAVGVVAWRSFSNRSPSPAPMGAPAYPPSATPAGAATGASTGSSLGSSLGASTGAYGPAYPPAPSAGRGLLGTGLAVAGGVAAGMLAEKLLTDHRHSDGSQLFPEASRGLGSNLSDERLDENTAAQVLEERPVDFGTGDGWGGDAAAADAGGADGGWD